MSLPEQIGVPDIYAALAPYNFVPLPERVVTAEAPPDQDRYHADRLTGRIDCRLTTASPLYVRAGWRPEDFVEHGEKSFSELKDAPGQQERRADFFHHGDPQRPLIPGSSLRGMLRALVEIVGYGKMERVTERQHFFFTLRFENLSHVELGALLWVLNLAADERYRLALGMGKPLGMGAVSISSSVYRDDRQARYSRLLDGAQWQTGEQALEQADQNDCTKAFDDYVLEKSGEQERGRTKLLEAPRMCCLLALLSWKEAPPAEKTGYMELDQFRDRPVLPPPTQVIGWELAPSAASAAPNQSQRQQVARAAAPIAAPAAPTPPEPAVELKKLELNIELTGNKKGILDTPLGRGVQVALNNLKDYELPKGKKVVGFLSQKDAGGSNSGGFRGTLVKILTDGTTIYLVLKPTPKG